MASISLSKSEKSYIQTSLTSTPPIRGDGRSLLDYRPIALEIGVVPLANGSVRLNIGKSTHEGAGGTEVLAAVKLEVEDVVNGDGVDGGRVVCSVSCSPAAYPHLSSNALDDLSYDMTTVLNQTLAHPSLRPSNLGILPKKKSWGLHLDLIVLADSGNVFDALFMAARAALWDTKVPVTRVVEYQAKKGGAVRQDDMDVEQESGLDTRQVSRAVDFELPDYWDEGETLAGQDRWPVCVTLNIVSPIYYLDATLQEEASTPLRLLLALSFPKTEAPTLKASRLLGPGEVELSQIKALVQDGEKHAGELFAALEAKLREEDVRRNQKARDRFILR
ncbi:ribosomal protein S5 domain 2-like protein [Neolentinus lepideus HHB14362 ss-1]|uniref:Ribosomal RNA-processing protein 42 n=1 Tax=Neolentinus lepideus HHB14362 ss-1 TaxID=1314782 RepID=A0A165VV32_9AGAM|nr:ribosomal protein S5 domain 2-like protein [Neolentinus lepideus HHB14362 ss-1]